MKEIGHTESTRRPHSRGRRARSDSSRQHLLNLLYKQKAPNHKDSLYRSHISCGVYWDSHTFSYYRGERTPLTSAAPASSQAFMASIVESGWRYLITNFNDFQLACLGSFFLHESVFFLSGLPFIYLERAGWLSKYKIQAKNNSPAAQEKCITRLVLYHFCVNLPVMIASYPVFKFMGMRSSLPLPSWKVVSTQIIFYFILEDFIFYWGHRVLHTKWLYKHVHSVHHEYATPFGLTSEYAHPAEILFLGFATIVGPAITGPHLITLWLWMVLRVLETVEAHCGYHFPWSLSNFLPLYGGADFHDYHHRLLYTKSGNYSSTFVYMDRIFGTDTGYRKLKALEKAGVEDDGEGTCYGKGTCNGKEM